MKLFTRSQKIPATSVTSDEPSSIFFGSFKTRLESKTLIFRFLAEINIILGAWYLYWRATNSLNFDALWLAIPLLIAEIYSYFGGVMFIIGMWRPLKRKVKSLDKMLPTLPSDDWPTVDVFITCYNESPDIVEKTARAALAMHYPTRKLRVYVLDDGNSAAMRAMTEHLSLEDLSCPQLQEQAELINIQRLILKKRLYKLEKLAPGIQMAELFIAASSSSESFFSTESKKFAIALKRLQQFILCLPSSSRTISERLVQEKKSVEAAIYEKDQELIHLVRVYYIARPKPPGKPHHAKAGNINYAIFSGETSGQFILTLDADHIVKPHFLKRVLPYFYTYNLFAGKYESNRIAFVQTPQDFYNIPKDDPFGHQAQLFYGPILQGKDGMNAAFYTGTNAILRREALVNVGLQNFAKEYKKDKNRLEEFDLVGGLSSNSITEDMNTAMRLHASGWQSVYHNELMAEGLAPDDLSSTLKQRLRWAQGTIQVLLRENPWKKPGLSFWQRLQYFQTMYSYFSGFATLIFVTSPIIYFFFEIVPIKSYGADFAVHFFPGFIINRLTFMTVSWGVPIKELWRCEQFSVALFPLFIQAVWSVFTGQKLKFEVTSKERQSGIFLKLVYPQLFIFGLTILGIIWSLYRFATGHLNHPLVHLVNAAWAVYNLALLWAVIRAAVWQPSTKSS
ncbi:MAG: glycosyltransferase [Scytonematopsis contorta HA4267-MV1]|jgi:cellulose synthase (UDP-forming)|nr:glycosyltransferase [Scytonematopsis contorta HA4267-MV1]